VIPFELKNVGAIFQRMVNKVFKVLIGSTIEVYVDDMLVKSVHRTYHLQHLDKEFDLLKQLKVMLNLGKCKFGVALRKFLGYLITQSGIKADPYQISAILNMKSSACVKEVQTLNGHLTALNRFISRSTDKMQALLPSLEEEWGLLSLERGI